MSWEAHTCPICNATVPVSIPHNCNDFMTPPTAPNRWATFTDDELEMLRSGLSWFWDRESEGRVRKTEALMRDMDAELERRRSVSDREAGGSS